MISYQVCLRPVTVLLLVLIGSSCAFSHPAPFCTNQIGQNNCHQTPLGAHASLTSTLSRSQRPISRIFDFTLIRGGDQEEPEQDTEQENIVGTEDQPTETREVPKSSETSTSTTPNKDRILAAAALPMASLGKIYTSWLDRSPILTKSATAGIIFALSDVLAQRLEKQPDESKPRKLEWSRIFASGIVGFAYFGPAAHYWYEWIFRIIPGTTLFYTLQKAALGQLLFGPTFTCVFFASSLIQSGTFSLGNWGRKIRQDLPGAWLAGAGFWPIVDLISYSVIPPQWIPLFVNLCSLIWTTYLVLKSYAK